MQLPIELTRYDCFEDGVGEYNQGSYYLDADVDPYLEELIKLRSQLADAEKLLSHAGLLQAQKEHLRYRRALEEIRKLTTQYRQDAFQVAVKHLVDYALGEETK